MDDSSRLNNTANTIVGLVRETRPWQWYKQGLMLLGIVFSQNIYSINAWVSLSVGIVAFTLLSSSTYILNDIIDIDKDRNHPEKKDRPLAAGQVSVLAAAIFGIVLFVIALGVAYRLGTVFFIILLAYFGQNILYSFYLKRVVFVDVLIVSIGFVLRAVAGVVVINVFLSPWLIVSTFLLALVLAFGKRRDELKVTNPQETRTVLGEYTKTNLDQLLMMVMATMLMSYSLYTFSRTDPAMMLTLPFAFFGVFRYHYLLHTTNIAGRPEYLFTDRPSVVNFIIWSLVTVAVLYNFPEVAISR